MPKIKKGLLNLNILFSQTNQPKLYSRIFRWLLSSGKYLVILVELAVIAGFVLRVKFDTDISEIQDKIKEQIPYIQALSDDERQVRLVQLQLSTIKQVKHDNPDFVSALNKISTLTPRVVRLTGINFDHTQAGSKTALKITGQSPSNYEVASFIKALQNDPTFTDITLASISIDKDVVNFSIIGNLTETNQIVKNS